MSNKNQTQINNNKIYVQNGETTRNLGRMIARRLP